MKNILFIIILSFPAFLNAQGITGRKIVLNYDFQFMSSYGIPPKNPKFRELPEYFKLASRNVLELDLILGKSWIIGPDWHFFSIHTLYEGPERSMILKNRGWGFHAKTFLTRKGGIAPLGFWWKLRLYRNAGSATLIADNSDAGKYYQWDMSISLGKQVSFQKYFLFNIGLGFDSNNMYYRFEENTYITENNFDGLIRDSLLVHHVLFIHLGLGWVAGK